MRLLLDTNASLWAVTSPARLTASAHAALREPANERLLSPVSSFELAQKASLGKLRLDAPVIDIVQRGMRDAVLHTLDLTHDHLAVVEQLPWHHRDPFDRMLIAQALSEGLPVITSDRRLADYGVEVL